MAGLAQHPEPLTLPCPSSGCPHASAEPRPLSGQSVPPPGPTPAALPVAPGAVQDQPSPSHRSRGGTGHRARFAVRATPALHRWDLRGGMQVPPPGLCFLSAQPRSLLQRRLPRPEPPGGLGVISVAEGARCPLSLPAGTAAPGTHTWHLQEPASSPASPRSPGPSLWLSSWDQHTFNPPAPGSLEKLKRCGEDMEGREHPKQTEYFADGNTNPQTAPWSPLRHIHSAPGRGEG